MMNIERRNLVRQAILADRTSRAGKEAWRRALRALVHEQQQLHTNETATDVMRALLSGVTHMSVTGADEDQAARMVVGLLQLEW
jgi:Arc/MetJ-type ribon-helix-helix transcriptional regulator